MRKNISHNKIWHSGAVKIHVEPPLIPLTKINNIAKANKDSVKIKLRRYTTSENPYWHRFKMDLFNNGKPEKFFLSVRNFQ